MNLFEIVKKQEIQDNSLEIKSTIKSFEKSDNELKFYRHVNTLNEGLVGKKHPDADIEYRKKYFIFDGKVVEGVFPVFDSKFETYLPKEIMNSSDTEQFKYCTKQLAQKIEYNKDLEREFTPRQLEQIKNGEPRISGLTWHHNESPGKMQLVDAEEHAICRHTGGRSIWGGGAECR